MHRVTATGNIIRNTAGAHRTQTAPLRIGLVAAHGGELRRLAKPAHAKTWGAVAAPPLEQLIAAAIARLRHRQEPWTVVPKEVREELAAEIALAIAAFLALQPGEVEAHSVAAMPVQPEQAALAALPVLEVEAVGVPAADGAGNKAE